MSRKQAAPYTAGDRARILHTCSDHGTCVAALPVERVTSQNHYRWAWRIRATRCDGSPVEVVVDKTGHDAHGYVEPVR